MELVGSTWLLSFTALSGGLSGVLARRALLGEIQKCLIWSLLLVTFPMPQADPDCQDLPDIPMDAGYKEVFLRLGGSWQHKGACQGDKDP